MRWPKNPTTHRVHGVRGNPQDQINARVEGREDRRIGVPSVRRVPADNGSLGLGIDVAIDGPRNDAGLADVEGFRDVGMAWRGDAIEGRQIPHAQSRGYRFGGPVQQHVDATVVSVEHRPRVIIRRLGR